MTISMTFTDEDLEATSNKAISFYLTKMVESEEFKSLSKEAKTVITDYVESHFVVLKRKDFWDNVFKFFGKYKKEKKIQDISFFVVELKSNIPHPDE